MRFSLKAVFLATAIVAVCSLYVSRMNPSVQILDTSAYASGTASQLGLSTNSTATQIRYHIHIEYRNSLFDSITELEGRLFNSKTDESYGNFNSDEVVRPGEIGSFDIVTDSKIENLAFEIRKAKTKNGQYSTAATLIRKTAHISK